MDGRRFIETIFSSDKTHSVTQVVMNLPNNAVDFLGLFSIAIFSVQVYVLIVITYTCRFLYE